MRMSVEFGIKWKSHICTCVDWGFEESAGTELLRVQSSVDISDTLQKTVQLTFEIEDIFQQLRNSCRVFQGATHGRFKNKSEDGNMEPQIR